MKKVTNKTAIIAVTSLTHTDERGFSKIAIRHKLVMLNKLNKSENKIRPCSPFDSLAYFVNLGLTKPAARCSWDKNPELI